jgi:molecular chaperone GrpE
MSDEPANKNADEPEASAETAETEKPADAAAEDKAENTADDKAEDTPEDMVEDTAEDTADVKIDIGDTVDINIPPSPDAVIADLNDRLLRLAAELENTRKRAERDRADALRYGVASFARDMVAVGDNLTRALNAIEESDRDGLPENVVNLLEGVAATERDLQATLQRNGVKALDPMGEKFDPNFHEAMFEAPGTGQESGSIIQVIEIGYMIGERLLRPAKVGVAKD